MDAAAELGRNPRFSLSMEMSWLTRDGTAESVSRDQTLRHVREQGNIHFPCSADREQDWQPYPVDRHSAICDDYTTYYIVTKRYEGERVITSSWRQPATQTNRDPNHDEKSLPGPITRAHRKLVGMKTMSLGTNYSFQHFCLEWYCQYFRIICITSYSEDCLCLMCCSFTK